MTNIKDDVFGDLDAFLDKAFGDILGGDSAAANVVTVEATAEHNQVDVNINLNCDSSSVVVDHCLQQFSESRLMRQQSNGSSSTTSNTCCSSTKGDITNAATTEEKRHSVKEVIVEHIFPAATMPKCTTFTDVMKDSQGAIAFDSDQDVIALASNTDETANVAIVSAPTAVNNGGAKKKLTIMPPSSCDTAVKSLRLIPSPRSLIDTSMPAPTCPPPPPPSGAKIQTPPSSPRWSCSPSIRTSGGSLFVSGPPPTGPPPPPPASGKGTSSPTNSPIKFKVISRSSPAGAGECAAVSVALPLPKVPPQSPPVENTILSPTTGNDENASDGSAIEKASRRRLLTAQEILSTEASYVNNLELIVDVFIASLRRTNAASPAVITACFSNLEAILAFNKNLLEMLTQRIRVWQEPGNDSLASIFLTLGPFLKLYTAYIGNFDDALGSVDKQMKTNSAFANIVRECELRKECGQLTLKAFLLEPVQRIPRYKLLLEQYLRFTPTTHHDHADTVRALALVADVAVHVNENVRAQENKQQILDIQNSFSNDNMIGNIVIPGRVLIRQGELVKECRKGPKKRMVYVFSDALLYGQLEVKSSSANIEKDKPPSMIPHRLITFDDMRVDDGTDAENELEYIGGDDVSGSSSDAFSVHSPDKSFVMHAKSVEDKNIWVTDLRNAIIEHQKKRSTFAAALVSSSSSSLSATVSASSAAPVWIKDKDASQCMECHVKFTLIVRRHHCRKCGKLVCDKCSSGRILLPSIDKADKVRVCRSCFRSSKPSKPPALTFSDDEAASSSGSLSPTLVSSNVSSPTAEISCTGTLYVRQLGGIFQRDWVRRWCVLRKDNWLYMYRAKKDGRPVSKLDMAPFNVIACTRADKVGKDNAFKAHGRGLRSYAFATESESDDDVKRWVASFCLIADPNRCEDHKGFGSTDFIGGLGLAGLAAQDALRNGGSGDASSQGEDDYDSYSDSDHNMD